MFMNVWTATNSFNSFRAPDIALFLWGSRWFYEFYMGLSEHNVPPHPQIGKHLMFPIKIDPFRRDIPHFEIMRPMRIFRGIPQFPRSSRIQGKGSSGGLWGWGWRPAGAFARWAGGRRWMGDRPVIDSVEVYNMINMYIMIYLISKYIQYIYIVSIYYLYIYVYFYVHVYMYKTY